MPNHVETRFTISGKDKDIVLGIIRNTKEGIRNSFIEDDEVYFRTTWNCLFPLFEKLARKYDISIQGHFVDYLVCSGVFEVKDKELSVEFDTEEEFLVKYWSQERLS